MSVPPAAAAPRTAPVPLPPAPHAPPAPPLSSPAACASASENKYDGHVSAGLSGVNTPSSMLCIPVTSDGVSGSWRKRADCAGFVHASRLGSRCARRNRDQVVPPTCGTICSNAHAPLPARCSEHSTACARCRLLSYASTHHGLIFLQPRRRRRILRLNRLPVPQLLLDAALSGIVPRPALRLQPRNALLHRRARAPWGRRLRQLASGAWEPACRAPPAMGEWLGGRARMGAVALLSVS